MPPVKIPREICTADLTTKHLGNAVILKHHQNLHIKHTTGKSKAAANLHALHSRAESKTDQVDRKLNSEKADVDSMKGVLRAPARGPLVQTGPGWKTRLRPPRTTRGAYDNGETFDITDDWRSRESDESGLRSGWTGRSIFFVDRGYSREFGTDQRRQRSTAENHRGPQGRPA